MTSVRIAPIRSVTHAFLGAKGNSAFTLVDPDGVKGASAFVLGVGLEI